ncbi:L,D-transpeptidase family protein [Parerythrobacter aurantius]|uniref:L,D-transpeptidase family protein n=1 Tax=Parerythrobacter aurantius TaxID=3127706 RepID=UPI003244C1D4
MRLRKFHCLPIASALALAACGLNGTDREKQGEAGQTAEAAPDDFGYDTYGGDNLADSMASNDEAYMEGAMSGQGLPDSDERPIMQAQVVLDRIGFGPGVIDGKMGMSTENALRGFQEANALEITGKLDEPTQSALAQWERIPATRVVTIPGSWGTADYKAIPEDPAEQAKVGKMGYRSLDERLAERFHTTIAVLRMLNPGGQPAGAPQGKGPNPQPTPTPDIGRPDGEEPSYFQAGQQIRVPNIGGDRITPGSLDNRDWQMTLASLGVGTEQPEVDRVVVSKAGKTLKAYAGNRLVALFTVSSGSSEFPLPLGDWKILGEAFNPPYAYDPEVLGKGDGKSYQLPPGPNSPVGVVWIDLSKEHYGIHGTPDPETIGRAQSSGCVRLTNWDAARLAQMVSQDTKVQFVA